MNIFARYGMRILVATPILIALALYLGCGSKKKTETPGTQQTTTQSPQTTGGMQAQTPAETADWSAYSNPTPGVDPVCGMSLDPNYVTVATIGDKKYACCSSHCAAMLTENPGKYLTAEAGGASSPEGHGH